MKSRSKLYREYSNELTTLLLSSANIPILYQWFTGLNIPLLMYLFGISACLGLDFTVVTQVYKDDKSVFTWLAIICASVFIGLIAISHYTVTINNGYLHACYAVVLLFVALSNAKNPVEVNSVNESLTDKEQEVLTFLKDNPNLNNEEVAKRLNLKTSSLYVYRSRLKAKGLL